MAFKAPPEGIEVDVTEAPSKDLTAANLDAPEGAGDDLRARIGRHVVQRQRGASEGRPLRVDEDPVAAGYREGLHIQEAAVSPHVRRSDKVCSVRFAYRDPRAAAGRGTEGDVAQLDADAAAAADVDHFAAEGAFVAGGEKGRGGVEEPRHAITD